MASSRPTGPLRPLWHLVVNGVMQSTLFPRRLRPLLLSALGVKVGKRVGFGRGVELMSNRLALGDRVYINQGVVINNSAEVVIEDDVALGPGAMITTTGHDSSNPLRRQGAVTLAPVRIGRGSWVGARAVVLPGVTVGEGCIIAAGAVVASDCKPHSVYGGVPARQIRELD